MLTISLYATGTVAEIVLCIILWDLGTPEPEVVEEEPIEPEPTEPDFEMVNDDEQAALKAHIWNMFIQAQAERDAGKVRITESMFRRRT